MKVISIFLILLVQTMGQDKGNHETTQASKTKIVTVPAGVTLTVRANEPISSKKNDVGDRFTGVLETAISANGAVVAERLSSVTGRVAGKRRDAQGDELVLEVVSVERLNGDILPVVTDPLIRRYQNSAATGAVRVGSTAGLGAAIGAIAGGGKAAAIGAAAGGAIGAAGATAPGKAVEVKIESVLVFRLREALRIERGQ